MISRQKKTTKKRERDEHSAHLKEKVEEGKSGV